MALQVATHYEIDPTTANIHCKDNLGINSFFCKYKMSIAWSALIGSQGAHANEQGLPCLRVNQLPQKIAHSKGTEYYNPGTPLYWSLHACL